MNSKRLYLRYNLFFYSILLAAHISLIWLLPYFPSQDGPVHIYNLTILNDLLHGGHDWGKFFIFKFRLIPNLGFYSIAYPLMQLFSPMTTERLFISLYILLMGLSFLYFLHSFKRPLFPLAFFIFFVIFNFNLMMGFYSYTITIPLLLIAISLQWKYRSWHEVYKFLLINSLGIILFIFHLIPFCLFLIFSVCISFVEKRKNKKIYVFFRRICTLIPCIVLFLFYFLGNKNVNPITLNITFFSNLKLKQFLFVRIYLITELFLFSTDIFSRLFLFSTNIFSRWKMIPFLIIIFFFILFAYESIKKIGSDYLNGYRIEITHKLLLGFVIIIFFIYIFAPSRWGVGSFFNQRFPWVIFLFSIPLLRIPNKKLLKKFNVIIIAVICFLFLINSIIFCKESIKIENYLVGSKIEIPEGAFVMGYKKPKREWARVDVLLHAISYYGISKKFVNLNFYQAYWLDTIFLIDFKFNPDDIPHISQIERAPEKINWALYPKVQYIIGYKIDKSDRKILKNYFHIIFDYKDLTFWKRYS